MIQQDPLQRSHEGRYIYGVYHLNVCPGGRIAYAPMIPNGPNNVNILINRVRAYNVNNTAWALHGSNETTSLKSAR